MSRSGICSTRSRARTAGGAGVGEASSTPGVTAAPSRRRDLIIHAASEDAPPRGGRDGVRIRIRSSTEQDDYRWAAAPQSTFAIRSRAPFSIPPPTVLTDIGPGCPGTRPEGGFDTFDRRVITIRAPTSPDGFHLRQGPSRRLHRGGHAAPGSARTNAGHPGVGARRAEARGRKQLGLWLTTTKIPACEECATPPAERCSDRTG